MDAAGNPWSGSYVCNSGNLPLDLLYNLMLESTGRLQKCRLYEMTANRTAMRSAGIDCDTALLSTPLSIAGPAPFDRRHASQLRLFLQRKTALSTVKPDSFLALPRRFCHAIIEP